MARKAKSLNQSKAPLIEEAVEQFSNILLKIEDEAEKIFKKIIQRTERSSRDLKRNLDDLLARVRTNGLYTVAHETRAEFEREIKRLAEDLTNRVRDIEILPLTGINRDKLISDAKKNLEDLVGRITSSDLVAKARNQAEKSKSQVLSFLSIPNQDEVERLNRKISSLEKRINTLSRKAA